MRYLPLLLFIFFTTSLQGQIVVLDGLNSKPIEYAHVIFTEEGGGRQFAVTGASGRTDNLLQSSGRIEVSFLGYETQTLNAMPGQTLVVKLVPGSNDLQEVVVTGQYRPVGEGQSLFPVKVLKSADFEARGAVTLNQALNNQLNIRISQDNVLGSGMSMQGLGGENVKILIDGVPLVGRLNGNIDLSQINLSEIERVEIVEGPLAVTYGSNALAGTINLITKKPRQETTGSLSQYYESVGVWQTDLMTNLSLSKHWNAKVGGNRYFFDGWSPTGLDTGRATQWNQKEQYNAFAGVGYQGSRLSINAEGRYLWEQIKDKGNRRSAYSDYAFDTWFTTGRSMGTLRGVFTPSARGNLQFMASGSYFNRSRIKYNRNLVEGTQEPTTNPEDHDTTVYVNVVSRSSWSSTLDGRWNYQVGYDFNYETAQGDRIGGGLQDMTDLGAFASVNWEPIPALSIQPGVRVAWNSRFATDPVPSVNVRFAPSGKWTLRGSYARGFRAPSLKELYMEFIDANHYIIGNPNLTPEYSHSAQASASRNVSWGRNKTLTITPSAFYNNLNNLIQLAPIDGLRYTYINLNNKQTWGGKLEAGLDIHPDFSFKAGGSLLWQTLDVDGSSSTTYLSPEATFLFSYWRPSKRFNFTVSYKFTGNTPLAAVDDFEQVSVITIPSYHLIDVSVTQKLWKNRIELTAGGKNLLNYTNFQVAGTGGVHSAGGNLPIAWGRSFFASLKVNLP